VVDSVLVGKRLAWLLGTGLLAACGGGKGDDDGDGGTWTFAFDGMNQTNMCSQSRYCIEAGAVLTFDGDLVDALSAGSSVDGTGRWSVDELPVIQCAPVDVYTILPSDQRGIAVITHAATVSFDGSITIRSATDEPLLEAMVVANANGGDRSHPFDLVSLHVETKSSTTITGTWDTGSGGPSVGNNSMGTFTARNTGTAGGDPTLEGRCGPQPIDAGVIDAPEIDAAMIDAPTDAAIDAGCNCTGLVHAQGISCPLGACDYTTCDGGYRDCDGNRMTGCEQQGLDCVEIIATGQLTPMDMTIDATNLYWANNDLAGGPMKMPLAGGAPTPIAPSPPNQDAEFIAVDATHVYWTGADRVKRAPITGGSFEYVDTTGFMPGALAVDATHVYWVRRHAYQIVRVPKGGGAITEVWGNTQGDPQMGINDVVLDATTVYWSQRGTGYRVGSRAKTLTGTVTLTDFMNPNQIALSGSELFVVGQNDGVRKMPAAGGAITDLYGPAVIVVLAVDGTNVYWGGDAGRIGRTPVGGGATTILASGQDPAGIAVDGTYVYWTNRSQGTIARVLK
jgi:hypothetical protein